jgi:bifunctional non-homologous end joining protein LigD
VKDARVAGHGDPQEIGCRRVLPKFTPMPLAVAREAFDHPDWIDEVKWDGFRALAYRWASVQTRLEAGREYKSWPYLCTELSPRFAAIRRSSTVRSFVYSLTAAAHFFNLMFRREWRYFMAFDLLWLYGEDLRGLPLHQRKRRLARIMPRVRLGRFRAAG